ncbi:methyltransferase domain-containing protein, partial [bacterium]|nr:methyltransferase domain-containing protein [bacterium]
MIYDSRGRDPQAPYDAYKDAVRTFYERETDRHGFNFRALGYKQRTSQQRRFAVLAEVGDLDGRSVLDVGCGLGDFVVHLSSRGIVPDYTGIDLCDHFVSACRRKFERPTGGPRFLAGDILDHERKPPYDYVVSCGLFGLRAEGTEVRVEATLRRMFDLCSRAVAVNFV